MAQYNQFVSRSQEVGGGIPVWVRIPEKRVAGWLLKNQLKIGEVVASGSPIEYNYKTHEGRILKCFEVISATTGTDSDVIVLKKTARTPQLYSGMNVMVCPSTLTEKGTAITLSDSMIKVGENDYTITVSTGALGALTSVKAGSFIVEAADAGASKAMYAIPNELTVDDTIGGNQNAGSIAFGIKNIYENMIPAMPDIVKNNIKYVEWEWFPEKGE